MLSYKQVVYYVRNRSVAVIQQCFIPDIHGFSMLDLCPDADVESLTHPDFRDETRRQTLGQRLRPRSVSLQKVCLKCSKVWTTLLAQTTGLHYNSVSELSFIGFNGLPCDKYILRPFVCHINFVFVGYSGGGCLGIWVSHTAKCLIANEEKKM